jgi:hypothetical protein
MTITLDDDLEIALRVVTAREHEIARRLTSRERRELLDAHHGHRWSPDYIRELVARISMGM